MRPIHIATLRRVPAARECSSYNVVLYAVILRCAACETQWRARLICDFNDNGPRVAAEDAICPRCRMMPPVD